MTTKDIKKMIKVVVNQSSKEEIKVFLAQVEEMIIIPIHNVLGLNNEELKELRQTLLTKTK